jgi:sugar lactone lactonase YvrE
MAQRPMKLRAASTFAVFALAPLFALAACSDALPETTAGQGAADTTDSGIAAMCSTLPTGPFTPERIGQPFNGSEDFTFDGQGHMIGKKGGNVLMVGPQAAGDTSIAALPGQTYGIRYRADGTLVAAIPGAGKLVTIAANGQVTDLLTGLRGPNGIHIDFVGNIWFTEFSGNKVSKLAPDGTLTALVSGSAMAQGADGIVLDAAHKRLFYTEYQKGRVNRLDVGVAGAQPVTVATISGAALDGMTLDACGNVYVVDNGVSRLFRVRLDQNGTAIAAPEMLAELPTNIAAANFGVGAGYDPQKLYMTGNPGVVYAIPIGVGGAPTPMPTR